MTIRQYALLRLFSDGTMLVADCLRLNQTTFGSVVFHGWVRFNAKQNFFFLSKSGVDAFASAKNPNLFRLATTHGGFSQRVHVTAQMLRVRNVRRTPVVEEETQLAVQ